MSNDRRLFVCVKQKTGVGEDVAKALKKELTTQGLKNQVLDGEKWRTQVQTCTCLDLCRHCKKGPGAALIGIALFGLLGGHAAAAARDERPALTRALTAAGVPAGPAVVQFETCFVRRSKAPDPNATPAGCQIPAGGPRAVGAAFVRAATSARAHNFLYSIERTLLFEVLVFGAAVLLVRALPKVAPGQLGQPTPAGE
ncbi:MAG: hypothetical protein H7233_12525 [Pseudorhodobacter sp.]|nr:hypothetical protein [Frankiaceae bacterium]